MTPEFELEFLLRQRHCWVVEDAGNGQSNFDLVAQSMARLNELKATLKVVDEREWLASRPRRGNWSKE
jgi:hypothetical protein